MAPTKREFKPESGNVDTYGFTLMGIGQIRRHIGDANLAGNN